MRRVFLIAIAPLFLSSCATLETTFDKSTPFAPVNEIRGGIVSYDPRGLGSNGRRNNAYKKAHEYCNGDYRILEEGEQLGMGTAVPIGGTVVYDNIRRWKIKFECVH